MPGVELAELIAQLRAELTEAMRAGESAGLRFELGPVELELAVEVGREVGGGGKVRFWVAELGADGKVSRTATQRIKLVLDPRQTGGAPDRGPLISGEEVDGER
ncbi:trypco2 family protein [Streptomyces sp. NPDC051576]|uniref:trypco2 family protein n=1 Tax=Streptomyces sp. NPDC051576 TaxID=3155803 RepID=UPI0034224F35